MIANQKDAVGLNDFNGGRSVTSRREDGRIHVSLSNRLLRGTPNEPSVLQVLAQRLEGQIGCGVDQDGQDGLLHTPSGDVLTIQLVTLPADPVINRRIGVGETIELDLTDGDAARWIASSIEHKRAVASPDVILALDARPFGLFADGAVIAAFHAAYPDLPGFNQIWLVGPEAPRTVRLR